MRRPATSGPASAAPAFTPVIALTASATAANREACKNRDGRFSHQAAAAHRTFRTTDPHPGPGRGAWLRSRRRFGPEPGANRSAPETPVAPILDDARIDRLLEELGPGPLQKVALTFVNEIPRRLADLHPGGRGRRRRGGAAQRTRFALTQCDAGSGRAGRAAQSCRGATDPVASLSRAPLDDLAETTLGLLHTKIFPARTRKAPDEGSFVQRRRRSRIARVGVRMWDDLLDAANVDGAYTALGNYPDEQLVALAGRRQNV